MFRFAALFLIALSLVSNAQGQLLRRQQFSPMTNSLELSTPTSVSRAEMTGSL